MTMYEDLTPKQRYRMDNQNERILASRWQEDDFWYFPPEIPDYTALTKKETQRQLRNLWPVLKAMALDGMDVSTAKNSHINQRLWQTMITAAMKLRTQAQ